jgi:acetyl-CoA acetyltransferase
MPEFGGPDVIEPTRELSRVAAIVGVGHTDYAIDYSAARKKEPGYAPPGSETLRQVAFDRALADSGLRRDDIDGFGLSAIYEPELPPQDVAKALSLEPRCYVRGEGMMVGIVPRSVAALAAGRCNAIALVYDAVSRQINRQFGGDTYSGSGRNSYYYYHPWGWSSQAAHWALMFQYYMSTYGATESDLGSVAVTLRNYATVNPDAIMRSPLSIEDYLESRYIVRPLHLFDLCLVNDGAICLILTTSDRAKDLLHTPVLIAGWGETEVTVSKMDYMVKDRLRSHLQDAGRQAFDMAGLSVSDVDHFQGYDASSIHLINQLEGYGFVEPGEGLNFCKDGQMALGGSLPVNTSGGMLSEAYMHGWNHVVEAVRQLRHEMGARQVQDIQISMSSVATTESAHPMLMARGD